MSEQKYTGSCYIGVVGSETENGECRDTIENIERMALDTPPRYIRATKGYEARQLHLNNWYEENRHPFILLLDHDMKFPPYTLNRLRSHGLPFVSGLYMRRRYNPIAPVWFDQGQPGQLPMVPWTAVVEDNTLYKLGASGWGCILMHRDVVTETRKILRGEPEILEDDMDLLPYDLNKIMAALHDLETLTDPKAIRSRKEAWTTLKQSVQVMKDEIRPLRGLKDTVGSDIRFPFYARLAGFDLIGDSGVMCEHMLNYPLNPKDYQMQSAGNVRDITLAMHKQVIEERDRIEKAVMI